MASPLTQGLSLPRQDAYSEAIEEILDVPGLSKVQAIMKKYNISYIVIDHKLKIGAKRVKHYCPKKERRDGW